ncbi:hypothetical protein BV394_12630 [Brevirhabdus pacifica]|uniref:Uncharacterized protein n=1 Tax=Brevirhabdus pacifica TaxID=1267768 RepID=A0A1U7DKF8_9RHOB|nr:hypothetical protein [Brevirhabdus pacifica]APX90470.1 hypothetical protein BV394_12630 [Brevirhabdus pacifica]OWU78512.1 hypothetical protein ATO5_06835 [Loktanella sp. 22II-4b]PJJ85428.1 hypothetical protein CLV77_2298 [Brevirhabdus pacifica]
MKTGSLALLLAMGLAASAISPSRLAAAPAQAGVDGQGFAQTCTHYGKRANGDEVEPFYISALADSCEVALAQLAAGPARDNRAPMAQTRARVFLERLTLLRQTVTAININRFLHVRTATQPTVAFKPVTKTGEYLIARRLGAFAAHRAFEAQADFKVSARK